MKSIHYILISIFFLCAFYTGAHIHSKQIFPCKDEGSIYVNVKGKPVYVGELKNMIQGDTTVTLVLLTNVR
jgi:hypothetical protein